MYGSTTGSSFVWPETEEFWPFAAGSLGEHLQTQVNGLIINASPGDTTQRMYSANNNSTSSPAVTRNTGLFTGAIDLSAVAAVPDSSPSVLISARHVLSAAHTGAPSTVVFKRADGGYTTRTVLSSYEIPDTFDIGGTTDIRISLLNSPVSDVTAMPVLPATWKKYFPKCDLAKDGSASQTIFYVPFVTGYMAGSALLLGVGQGDKIKASTGGPHSIETFCPPTYSKWKNWGAVIDEGDSGCPVLLTVNDRAVLFGSWRASILAGGSFCAVSENITDIETAMNTLASAAGDGTSYSLDKVDLSEFATEW